MNPADLVSTMVSAAKGSLGTDWIKVATYAESEFERLAASLANIAKLVADKRISGQEAESLLRIHRNTTMTVMLTVEGMGIIAVETAINAALGAVKDLVNGAAGVRIL